VGANMPVRYNLVFLWSVLSIQFLFLHGVQDEYTIYLSPQDSCTNNLDSRFNVIIQPPFADHFVNKQHQREMVAYVQAQDRHYRQNFHIGFNEFNNAISLGYQDFIDKAFNRLHLSDDAMRELWKIYLDSSFFKRKSNVQKYSHIVEEKIKQRNQATKPTQKIVPVAHSTQEAFGKQIEQELLNFEEVLNATENEYQSCNFDITNCTNSELEKHWNKRQDALLETTEQDYDQYDQLYNLTPQVCGYLKAHGIDYNDFQGFFGTALQQQLHGEMCDVLSQAALLQAQSRRLDGRESCSRSMGYLS